MLAMLSGMLSSGQKMGPEMLAGMLQKSGKSVSPQLLSTLLSLVGDGAKGESAGEDSSKLKQLSSIGGQGGSCHGILKNDSS